MVDSLVQDGLCDSNVEVSKVVDVGSEVEVYVADVVSLNV
jgi:hypothetical protein